MLTNLYKFYDKWVIPLAAALFLMLIPIKADALADSLGFARTYQRSCTTGTPIDLCPLQTGANHIPCSFQAFKVWNNSATPVYLGGSDVNTSTKGMPYCTDTAVCISASEPIDGSPGAWYCSAGSVVTVTIMAGRK